MVSFFFLRIISHFNFFSYLNVHNPRPAWFFDTNALVLWPHLPTLSNYFTKLKHWCNSSTGFDSSSFATDKVFILLIGEFCVNFTNISWETTTRNKFLVKIVQKIRSLKPHSWNVCKILTKLTKIENISYLNDDYKKLSKSVFCSVTHSGTDWRKFITVCYLFLLNPSTNLTTSVKKFLSLVIWSEFKYKISRLIINIVIYLRSVHSY